MVFTIEMTPDNKYDIRIGQGPMYGMKVGTAEQVRMSSVTIEDGPIFHGRVEAVWGMELSPGVDMNAVTVRAVGIGGTFLPMKKTGKAFANGRDLLSVQDGGRLAACPTLHLGSSIRFSLYKQ